MVSLYLTIKPSLIAAYINHICSCCGAWAKVLLQLLWHNSNNIQYTEAYIISYLMRSFATQKLIFAAADRANTLNSVTTLLLTQRKICNCWHNFIRLLIQQILCNCWHNIFYPTADTADTLVLMEQQRVTSSWYNRYLATDDPSSTQLLIQRLLWNSWKNIVYPAAAKNDTLQLMT